MRRRRARSTSRRPLPDAIAIYLLSLYLDVDYYELRERDYPLLAPPALAERLRKVNELFPPRAASNSTSSTSAVPSSARAWRRHDCPSSRNASGNLSGSRHCGLPRGRIRRHGFHEYLHSASRGRREVTLFIYTHVREDQIALFGFHLAEEKALFEKLLSVGGIGPKLAVNILGAMNTRELAGAIRGGDAARLTRMPGIGKKTAERMVLESRTNSLNLEQHRRRIAPGISSKRMYSRHSSTWATSRRPRKRRWNDLPPLTDAASSSCSKPR